MFIKLFSLANVGFASHLRVLGRHLFVTTCHRVYQAVPLRWTVPSRDSAPGSHMFFVQCLPNTATSPACEHIWQCHQFSKDFDERNDILLGKLSDNKIIDVKKSSSEELEKNIDSIVKVQRPKINQKMIESIKEIFGEDFEIALN